MGKIEKYLWVFRLIVFIILYNALTPFFKAIFSIERDCKDEMNQLKFDRSEKILIKELVSKNGIIEYHIEGLDLYKNVRTEYKNSNRQIQPLFGPITEEGDTFILYKNNYTYILAKEECRHLYEWKCIDNIGYKFQYIDSTNTLNKIPRCVKPNYESAITF